VGEELGAGFMSTYFERAKRWSLELGGVAIDAARLDTTVEVLRKMAEMGSGGDLRFLGYAAELFRLMLVELRPNDHAEAFTPIPANSALVGLEVVPTKRSPANAKAWVVRWWARYVDRVFPVEYEVDYYPQFNLLHIHPNLDWCLQLGAAQQPAPQQLLDTLKVLKHLSERER